MTHDVIIIGAGVVGGAVARNLARYNLSILCLEKEADVCCGISKGNTGIIHTPALVHGKTKKAEFTVKSNPLFEQLSRELGFVYQRTGSLVLGFSEADRKTLEGYKSQGEENRRNYGAPGSDHPPYRILERAELDEIEPGLSPQVSCALFAPDTGRIIPYEYGIGLWENALANGVELKLNSEVTGINRTGGWEVRTADGKSHHASYIVNAAGHGSGPLGEAAGFKNHEIFRVKGEYLILDRRKSPRLNHILFQAPAKGKSSLGKGILVTNTVYGNLMIGPDARWVDEEKMNEAYGTELEALKEVIAGAMKSFSDFDPKFTIKTFAGLRPKPAGGDFIIESEGGFINLCGIESPGLTSSPAIADEVAKLLEKEGLELLENPGFNPLRKPIVEKVLDLDMKEVAARAGLDDGDPERLVCRCEQVPEGRIRDAAARGIPVTTQDGIKRRCRAGQGSCQGQFCGPRLKPLLAEAAGLDEEDISRRGREQGYPRVTPAELRKALD